MEEDNKWPSFTNLHKMIKEFSRTEGQPADLFFEIDVAMSEKIDGSNLGIQVGKNSETLEWEVTSDFPGFPFIVSLIVPLPSQFVNSLIGRNSILWPDSKNKPINTVGKYGNAGSLGDLPIVMKEFSIRVAEACGLSELIVYGEAFRASGARKASWHPFGYRLLSESSVQMLTCATYDMFSSACSPQHPRFTCHSDLMQYLSSATEHVVFPPPIYFEGKLKDGIETLLPIVAQPSSRLFEGLFIVAQNNTMGFKWKTGLHEEQVSIPAVDSLNFESVMSKQLYAQLQGLFESRLTIKAAVEAEASAVKAAAKQNNDEMPRLVGVAMERELSKSADISSIVKKDRMALVDAFMERVVKEITSRFEEDEVPCPWTPEAIRAQSKALVIKMIMNA